VRVTDLFGLTNVASTTIDVFDNRPIASFMASPNPASPNQSINFDASSSSHARPDRQITSYTWNFGDGTTATGVNVTHAFAAFGSYTVTLTVADNNVPKKMATASTTVVINQGNLPPVAHANGPYAANLGETLALNANGSVDPNAAAGDSIVGYSWNVAQGALTLTGPDPALTASQINALRSTFGTGAALPIALTVTDEFGVTGTAATTLTIYNNRPSAALTAVPVAAAPAQAVTLDASASSHGRPIDRRIVRYDFAFGDGTTYTETPSNAPDGQFDGKTTHAYTSFGTIAASVTVTDNNAPGKTATASTTINITQGNHAPVADSGGPYNVALGSGVTLDGRGSLDPDAAAGDSIVSYAWNIAGGQFLRNGAMPALTAAELNTLGPGTFPIVLTVTDEFGLTAAGQTTLTIVPPNRLPVADAGGPYFVAEGREFQLEGTGSSDLDEPNTALVFAWDLDFEFVTFDVDAVGEQPTVTLVNDFLPRTIALRVTDSAGASTISTSTLQVSNLAPLLDSSGQLSLVPVEQNNADHDGTLIADLLANAATGNPISDPGADPTGIAIVAADSTHGAWEYSVDNGTHWQSLSAVSESNARLLAADANSRIRLIPDGQFDGRIDQAINFRAWDQSQGARGGTFNIAANGTGGNTAFSIHTETAEQFVTPRLTTQPGLTGVTLVNGTLTVEGDDSDNVITITGIGVGTGVFEVVTQHGKQTVSGITGGITVDLDGGNDSLTMNNVYVAGAIDIQTGDGDDTVVLGNDDVVTSGGELRVDLGAGDDRLDGKRLYIGSHQFIQGGDGNDALIFDGFLSPQFTLGTSAAGNVAWSGGSGNDTVHVIYAFVVGAWVVDLGAGDDAVAVYGSAVSGDIIVMGGSGTDGFNIDTNFFDANLRIEGNDGSDSVLLANGLGTEVALIQTHGQGDKVTVGNQTAFQLHVDTGAGEDEVNVTSSAMDRFFALLGDSNDALTFRGNRFRSTVDLDGSAGDADRLSEQNNTFLAIHRRRGFEVFR
jgi:PKD repeat protein